MSKGSSETDVSEFAVIPWTRPGARSAVITQIPVGKLPMTRRNKSADSDVVGIGID
jgi:hypothetical protein